MHPIRRGVVIVSIHAPTRGATATQNTPAAISPAGPRIANLLRQKRVTRSISFRHVKEPIVAGSQAIANVPRKSMALGVGAACQTIRRPFMSGARWTPWCSMRRSQLDPRK